MVRADTTGCLMSKPAKFRVVHQDKNSGYVVWRPVPRKGQVNSCHNGTVMCRLVSQDEREIAVFSSSVQQQIEPALFICAGVVVAGQVPRQETF